MKKWLEKLTELMLYGGLKKEQYHMIASDIDESNRKTIVLLSGACALVYGIRLSMFFLKVPDINKIIFLTGVLLFGVLAALNHFLKKNRILIHLSAYLFMAVYLGVGIISSIGAGSIHERTTLYLVFVVVAPMMFALNAVELSAVVLPAEIIYLIMIAKYQSAYLVYATNKSNSLFFSVTGLLLGIYMANMKISGIYNVYMNSRMEEIKQLNNELHESQEKLQKALEEAEYANRSKTAFLNNMSHDIRTPMNAIIGFTSLSEIHIDDRALVKDYLGKIMVSSRHLLSLINDVLDMSRIESGKVSIETKPVCLSETLEEIRSIIQPETEAKEQHFSIDVRNLSDDYVMADKLRLNQVLINILSNAIKFTGIGGKISLCMTQKSVESEGYADYELRIKDNGIGMSRKFQEHIFEAFTREESEVVGQIQGTGLGMAITKSIVDMMGGTITVDSEEGKGTEFIINLRFVVCTETDISKVTSEDTGNEKNAVGFYGKKVLLVEDNELNREIAECILTENGFAVDTAQDGEEAVTKMRNANAGQYDLILMDIQMPKLNGYEATRQIRAFQEKDKADIPVIAMTANAFEEDRQAAFDAGMNGHIAKPVEIESLVKTLREILY